jgi:hypothetical protein
MGKILSGFSNLSRSTRLSEAEGLSFLNKGGVTYVTGKQVTNVYEHCPSSRVYHVIIADLKFGCAHI